MVYNLTDIDIRNELEYNGNTSVIKDGTRYQYIYKLFIRFYFMYNTVVLKTSNTIIKLC